MSSDDNNTHVIKMKLSDTGMHIISVPRKLTKEIDIDNDFLYVLQCQYRNEFMSVYIMNEEIS